MSDADPTPTLPAGGDERKKRRELRTNASLRAVIRLSDGTEIPSILKDISKTGARLGVPASRVLPPTFMFRVLGRDFVCLARLAWQRDGYAGVRIERIAKLPA